jgi:hypothetical protein
VFFATVPVGALGVLLAPFLLHERSDPSASPKLDAAGAAIVTAALALLVYGCTQAEEAGLASPGTLGSLGLSVALVAAFVGGLGTGGTLTGVGRRLKRHDPKVKVIAAEPELGDLVYGLRSLDDGFVPPIFDESLLDRKFLVNVADSVRATRELTEREGIFAGISSGAVLHVGLRVASELERGDVVCLLADGGWKYLSTQAWAPELERAEKNVSETLWW